MTGDESIKEFRRLLRDDGLNGAVAFLNKHAPHRFTAVFRFVGPVLHNVCLVDSGDGATTPAPDALVRESYCVYVQNSRRPFEVNHAREDQRVMGHPKREVFQAYYGVPLISGAREVIGTLCHFDEHPVHMQDDTLTLLEEAAPYVASVLEAESA